MAFESATVALIAFHIANRVSEFFTSLAYFGKRQPSIEMPLPFLFETMSLLCVLASVAHETGLTSDAFSTSIVVFLKAA